MYQRPGIRARHAWTRIVATSATFVVLGACAMSMWAVGAAHGDSTANVVVSMTVPSATDIVPDGCETGSAATTFGTVLPDTPPGSPIVTTTDCAIVFGSSNDSSMLSIEQTVGATDTSTGTPSAAMYTTSNGSLDASFDDGSGSGWTTTDFSSGNQDEIGEIAIQPDGKIVAGGEEDGTGGFDFALTRYDADGSLDTGTPFGTGGKVHTDFGGSSDWIWGIAVQPADDKIVTAGSSDDDFAVARYDSDGSLDTGDFGSGTGSVITDLGGDDYAFDIAVQPDGKIVVGGTTDASGTTKLALVRYDSDGSLDSTFGTGGEELPNIACANNMIAHTRVALQPDGKIVAICEQGGNFLVARFLSTGLLDSTGNDTTDAFGGANGYVTTDFGGGDDGDDGLAIQSDGRIVAAGWTNASGNYDFAVARYLADGTIDSTANDPAGSFGTNGMETLNFSGTSSDVGRALAVQPDGDIVVAGDSNASGSEDFAVARYLPDGALDTTHFGTGTGMVTTNFSGASDDQVYDAKIAADGKIVVAGYSDQAGTTDFAVAEYAGGTTIADFDSGTTDWSNGTSSVFGTCLDAVSGGADATWTANAGCTAGGQWYAVPTSTVTVASQASNYAVSPTAEVDFQFGLRVASDQQPGTYEAPIAFDVTAPDL